MELSAGGDSSRFDDLIQIAKYWLRKYETKEFHPLPTLQLQTGRSFLLQLPKFDVEKRPGYHHLVDSEPAILV